MEQQNKDKNSSSRHPRRLLSGGFLIGYLEKGKALFTTAKQAGDSRQRHSGLTALFNVHAFTLIELLVVVLIIGILAAIALPQYQKAVEKSRAVQGMTMVKSIYQAALEYYMANGTYPSNFDDLSISVPCTGHEKGDSRPGNAATCSDGEWSYQLYTSDSKAIFANRLTGPYKGAGFYMYLEATAGQPEHTLTCVERISNGVLFEKAAGDFCQKLFAGTLYITTDSTRVYSLP